jgi:hypothetical protein
VINRYTKVIQIRLILGDEWYDSNDMLIPEAWSMLRENLDAVGALWQGGEQYSEEA